MINEEQLIFWLFISVFAVLSIIKTRRRRISLKKSLQEVAKEPPDHQEHKRVSGGGEKSTTAITMTPAGRAGSVVYLHTAPSSSVSSEELLSATGEPIIAPAAGDKQAGEVRIGVSSSSSSSSSSSNEALQLRPLKSARSPSIYTIDSDFNNLLINHEDSTHDFAQLRKQETSFAAGATNEPLTANKTERSSSDQQNKRPADQNVIIDITCVCVYNCSLNQKDFN